MKKITILFSLALGVFSMTKADAQAGAYAFAASSGTFTPITGGTDVNSIEADSQLSTSLPIGFTFNFEGVDYTDLKASSNGFLSFNLTGTSNLTANNLDAVAANSRPLLAPFWDDLDDVVGSAASYVVTGTAPNQVFTFEWLNWERYDFSNSDPILSFQVKLYETTNVIEFIYRGESGTISTSTSASIGITGASSFISLDGTGTSPAASNSTETDNLSAVPADGQVYSFTPPSCSFPTALMTSNLEATSTDIDWSTGGASNWNVEYGPAGFTPGSGTFVVNVAKPITINSLAAETDYDFYVQDSCGTGDVSFWNMITFTTTPTCPDPTNLVLSNTTPTSTDIDWTSGGASNWNVEYGPAGFTPGTGTSVINAAKPLSINSLMVATGYDIYVQDSCGNGDVSDWGMINFTTPCNGITTFPWTEDFEGITTPDLPSCWGVNNGGSSDFFRTWSTYGSSSSNAAGLYTDFNSGNNDDYLILPPFILTGNERLTFSVRSRSTGEPNDYKVVLSTTGSNPADFSTELKPLTVVANTTQTPINPIDLSAYTGNVFIAIHVPNGGLDGYYIYFDDFLVEEIPACVAPTNLLATSITDTVAVFGWTTGGAANANLEFGPAGFTQGTGVMVTNAFNPTTIDTLSPNTTYDFYVQDSCGTGDVSAWVGPFTFQTELGSCSSLTAITLPFIEDFENITDSVVGTSSIYCGADKAWDFYTDNDSYGRLIIGNGSPVNNGGSGAAILDVSTNSNNAVNDLVLTLDMSNYTVSDNIFLSFDFGDFGDENHGNDKVWIRGSSNDTWIEVYDWQGQAENVWHSVTQEIFISSELNTAGQVLSSSFQVKFGQEDNFAYNSDGLAIDNILIEVVSCPMPTTLSSTYQNEDSVVLNWNAGLNESMWNIEYGPIGYTQGSGTTVVSSDTTDTIVGLDLGSVYEFYVQADCGGGDASSWVGPITVATPVTNDSTCDAIVITPNTDYSSQVFSNIGATLQYNESILPSTQNNTVWFKTAIPASGHLLIATCGSNFNTIVGAYAYDTIICDSIETFGQVAYNSSNFGLCGQSFRGSVEICGATPGDSILFYVGGSSSTQSGLINLTVTDYSLDGYAGEGSATPVSACAGDTVDLWSNLTGQLLTTGDWEYPSNSSAIVDDTTVNTGAFSLVGNEVYYIVDNTCDADTAIVTIDAATVTNTGTAISNFQACSNGDVFLFDGLTGTFDAGGTWSTNSGAPFNGNKFIANGLPNGGYFFTYTVDNNICPPASTQIEVNLVDCTNITEGEATTFGVYPNPNDGTFFITNGKNDNNIAMEVIDVQGKVIYSSTYNMAAGSQQEVSLGNVESGVYLVRVITNNQVFNTNVIVK